MDFEKILKEHPLKSVVRGRMSLDELQGKLKPLLAERTPSVTVL